MYRHNQNLFDNLSCPASLDRTLLIDRILLRSADYEPVYPDLTFFRLFVKSWSAGRLRAWERLAYMYTCEYNPLENYDMKEKWFDDSNSHNKSENEGKVSGYNTHDYHPSRLNLGESKSTARNDHEGRRHGNLGTMTTQTMIEQEVNLWKEYDVYDVIANEFVNTFCVQIY